MFNLYFISLCIYNYIPQGKFNWNKSRTRFLKIFSHPVTSMLETKGVGDNFKTLVSPFHISIGHQDSRDVTNIEIQSPTSRCHPHHCHPVTQTWSISTPYGKLFLSKCSDASIFRFACIIYYDGNWYQRCLWKLSKRTFRWWNKFTGKFSSWCSKLALWLVYLLTHRWWLISTNLKTSYSWQRWWIHKVLLKVKNGNIWGKIQKHVLVFEIYFSQIIFFRRKFIFEKVSF